MEHSILNLCIQIIGVVLIFFCSLYFSIGIHELGHVFVGLIYKSKFHFYKAGPVEVKKTCQGWTFTINKDSLGGNGVMLPPSKIVNDRRRLNAFLSIYLMGGPVVSVMLCITVYGLILKCFTNTSLFVTALSLASPTIFVALNSFSNQYHNGFSDIKAYKILKTENEKNIVESFYRCVYAYIAIELLGAEEALSSGYHLDRNDINVLLNSENTGIKSVGSIIEKKINSRIECE